MARPCAIVLLAGVIAAAGCATEPQEASAVVTPALLLTPDAPEFAERAPAVAVVRLETTKGPVDIEVTRAWSPLGADRFIALVRHGYYDDARVFRVTAGAEKRRPFPRLVDEALAVFFGQARVGGGRGSESGGYVASDPLSNLIWNDPVKSARW
jgi:hypothetical protein